MPPKAKEAPAPVKPDTRKMAPVDEGKYAEAFTSFSFQDLAGNRIVIKPWSMARAEEGYALVGEIIADIKTYTEYLDLNYFFTTHLDVFFKKYIGKFNQLLLLSVPGKDATWLEQIDTSMGLAAIHAVWQQNFLGERIQDQIAKFLVPAAVGGALPQESPAPPATPDLSLPGLGS